jgi:hypothetical protein
MKNLPILTLIPRIWMLVIFAVLANLACLNERLFQTCGALIYIPAVTSIAALVVFAVLHLHFRQTIDAYIHSGKFVSDFYHALSPAERVRWTFAMIISLLLFVAVIAAGVGK